MHARHRLLLALLAIAAAVLPCAEAFGAPDIRSARFSEPAVAGQPATLEVKGVDDDFGVRGIIVAFAGEGVYGSSSCRYGAKIKRRLRTVSVPHTFPTAGPRPMVVRMDAGGCRRGGGATLQQYLVTPVDLGQPPVAPETVGEPVFFDVVPGNANPDVNHPDVTPGPGEMPPGLDPDRPDPGRPAKQGGARAVAAGGCTNADAEPTVDNVLQVREATLCLVNAERAKRGMRPFRADRRLISAAGAHSFDMVVRAYFSHVSPEGGTLTKRLKRARWLPRRHWSAGENIAFGELYYSTPRATVEGWMQSTGHRQNILTRAWRLAGIGVVPGLPASLTGGATYTAVFGR